MANSRNRRKTQLPFVSNACALLRAHQQPRGPPWRAPTPPLSTLCAIFIRSTTRAGEHRALYPYLSTTSLYHRVLLSPPNQRGGSTFVSTRGSIPVSVKVLHVPIVPCHDTSRILRAAAVLTQSDRQAESARSVNCSDKPGRLRYPSANTGSELGRTFRKFQGPMKPSPMRAASRWRWNASRDPCLPTEPRLGGAEVAEAPDIPTAAVGTARRAVPVWGWPAPRQDGGTRGSLRA